MRTTSSIRTAALALVCLAAAASLAQKKPLDHSVYDGWKSIAQRTMSNDGRFVAYAITPQEGDNVVEVKSLGPGGPTYTFERGQGIRFTADSRYLVATIVPKFAEARQARRDRRAPSEQPQNALLILDLQTGDKRTIDRVSSWSMAAEGGAWLMYRPVPETQPSAPASPTNPAVANAFSLLSPPQQLDEEDLAMPGAPRPFWLLGDVDQGRPAGAPGQRPGGAAGQPGQGQSPARQGELHIALQIGTNNTLRFPNATGFTFSRDGKTLVVANGTRDFKEDGIVWVNLETRLQTEVIKAKGRYTRLTLDEAGKKLAFQTDKDDADARRPAISAYVWSAGDKVPKLAAKAGMEGLPKDWIIASSGPFSFSKSGRRLLFATQPKPLDPAPQLPEDERVTLDVWHWQDRQLQPQQVLTAAAEAARSFEAVAFLDTGKLVQLESRELPSVTIGNSGDGDHGLAVSSLRWQRAQSWGEGGTDIFLVDIRTGASRMIFERHDGSAVLSPTGRYVIASNDRTKEMFSINTATGAKVSILRGVTESLYDELNDVPAPANPYGFVGWTKDDTRVYLNSKYDIWALDPTGRTSAFSATRGYGRITRTELRMLNLDPDAEFLDPGKPVLINASNDRSKASGVYWGDLSGKEWPKKIVMKDAAVGGIIKAKDSGMVTFTEQTFQTFPDVWVSNDVTLASPRRLSDANPQQKDYRWGKAELVEWKSNDGVDLQGILIKPDDMDPRKQYPMVVYFYERLADNLHRFVSPAPSASTINPSFFASNGYVVFMPDIPYREGYPGKSAMSAIMPGVQKVLEMGFVDPKKMGLQGQSWGGYQTAYMITETTMFAAACAGAPVSNMFSAYGGIRWGSGLVRQFQYEVGQSRIGGSMWEMPMRYWENSPIFFADKVRTPLLMMSNDQDGAVPWYQGIEYFTALRRLNQPVWMLNYNGEDHNLVQRRNRKDFSVRLSQFFDHYLKGAPMPVWMAEGIPATMKGRTMGLELTKPGG